MEAPGVAQIPRPRRQEGHSPFLVEAKTSTGSNDFPGTSLGGSLSLALESSAFPTLAAHRKPPERFTKFSACVPPLEVPALLAWSVVCQQDFLRSIHSFSSHSFPSANNYRVSLIWS